MSRREHTVEAEQLGAAFREEQARHKRAIGRAMLRAAHRGMPIVVKATPSDRGTARAAWQVRKRFNKHGTPIGADLYNSAPHAGILEMGARPHWPPLMPILRWVVRKFGLQLNQKGKRSFESFDEVPYGTYLVARAIQKKIAQKGSKAHRMVGNNLTKLRLIALRETKREL